MLFFPAYPGIRCLFFFFRPRRPENFEKRYVRYSIATKKRFRAEKFSNYVRRCRLNNPKAKRVTCYIRIKAQTFPLEINQFILLLSASMLSVYASANLRTMLLKGFNRIINKTRRLYQNELEPTFSLAKFREKTERTLRIFSRVYRAITQYDESRRRGEVGFATISKTLSDCSSG